MSRRRNKKYSAELKLEAVQAYLNGEGSYEILRKKFGLLSSTQLKEWVKWYNGHKEIKERRVAGTEIYMTKGRTKPVEEMSDTERLHMENKILKAQLKDAEMENKLLKN